MRVAKNIELKMKSGETVNIDVSDVLLEKIRSTFELQSADQVTERHVKYFLVSSMKNMLETHNE